MRRVVSVLAVMALLVGALAVPALADAVPPPKEFGGPPILSGNIENPNAALVFHCNAPVLGGKGNAVFNKNHAHNNCQ